MGIYSAMSIAVSGLKAQSYALGHISGNIANSQTVGFKRTETSFADLVPTSPYYRQIAGGVEAFSRGTNSVQGDVRAASTPTNMAINGDGFFVVERQTDVSDGLPVFGGGDYYTRRGDFEFDKHGYLVNGAGYYLKAVKVDPQTGNVVGNQPQTVRITNDLLPASATTQITMRGNLPSYPLTANADSSVPGSELLNPADFNNDPSVGADAVIEGGDASLFLEQSIAGGSITVYDAGGAAVDIQLRWAKMDNNPDTWNLFYLTDANATGTDPAWVNAGQNYVFDGNGQLDPPVPQVVMPNVSVNGADLGDITIRHGQSGLTQFADPNGTTQLTEFRQNGYPAGELIDVSISEAGRIVGSYTNGRTIDLYQVSLASFNAPNRLEKLDGGAFKATQDSGAPALGAQGTIIGSALEGSNTDIADEFTKLIVTQQAYSAGTRVVTTSADMLKEVLNMIR